MDAHIACDHFTAVPPEVVLLKFRNIWVAGHLVSRGTKVVISRAQSGYLWWRRRVRPHFVREQAALERVLESGLVEVALAEDTVEPATGAEAIGLKAAGRGRSRHHAASAEEPIDNSASPTTAARDRRAG
jgi:hypothetical protein